MYLCEQMDECNCSGDHANICQMHNPYFSLSGAEGKPGTCNLAWHCGKLLTLCFYICPSQGDLGLCVRILGAGRDSETEDDRKEFLGNVVESDLATV